jgi:hypothetical protein
MISWIADYNFIRSCEFVDGKVAVKKRPEGLAL